MGHLLQKTIAILLLIDPIFNYKKAQAVTSRKI